MADESSEGRRYSYKPKKKVQSNRKPVPRANQRAETPTERKRESGAKRRYALSPGKPKDVRKPTGAEVQRGKVAERDRRTERVYRRPPQETVPPYADMYVAQESLQDRPDLGWRGANYRLPNPTSTGMTTVPMDAVEVVERDRPDPMIQPQVGPVGDLRSRAAHTYGYTPEAYKEFRKTPVRLVPHESLTKDQGGYYDGGSLGWRDTWSGRNTSYPFGSGEIVLGYNDPGLLAHEQAHRWFDRQGFANTPGYQNAYEQDLHDWSRDYGSPATDAISDLDNSIRETDLYKDPNAYPTEHYARTVQFSPTSDRSNWPDYVRPYYNGFLQGMDRLSNGDYTPYPSYVPPRRPEDNTIPPIP